MTMRRASKAREQAELPAGYQFGDARRDVDRDYHVAADAYMAGWARWRAPHLNAADRLQRAGDRLNALPVPTRSAEDLEMLAEVNGWNVIEGEHHE